MNETGVPPIPAELLEVLNPVIRAPETAYSWWTASEPELDGESPASWLSKGRDFDAVLVQAPRYAAVLAH